MGFECLGAKKTSKKTIEILAVLFIVSTLLGMAFSFIGLVDAVKVEAAIKKIFLASPFLLAYLFIVRVIAEEIFFRGFLVKEIGIIGSAVSFGLMHVLYFSIAEVIAATVLGVLLAWFYKRNKSLYPNIIAHMAYNIASFGLMW